MKLIDIQKTYINTYREGNINKNTGKTILIHTEKEYINRHTEKLY